jgi:ornithine carbamoyltransferase
MAVLMGMIFEKSSTRTRVSFEAGMAQMGGHAIFLSPRDSQLGRGEPVEDSARVISRMVDLVMIRTFGHDIIERFAAHSSVPVINGLTDDHHPCQLLADLQTYVELRGDIRGQQVAWIGDGNNMCNSYIEAARLFDFELRIACPAGFEPRAELLASGSSHVTLLRDPITATTGANLVVTDVWASMGQESQGEQRRSGLRRLSGFTGLDGPCRQRCALHALPAGPPRRRGQRDDARRPPLGGVGRGREPPACTEGADGVAAATTLSSACIAPSQPRAATIVTIVIQPSSTVN